MNGTCKIQIHKKSVNSIFSLMVMAEWDRQYAYEILNPLKIFSYDLFFQTI